MDGRITDVLLSPRYAKRAAGLVAELDGIDGGIGADDIAVRRTAVRRLRSLATAELGWLMLPVREYFLRPATQRLLAGRLHTETDAKLRFEILRIIRHASEAYVTHPLWEPLHTVDETNVWHGWVHPIAQEFATAAEPDARAEAAYLLALCGDAHAWDVFQELIPRRSGALGLMELAVAKYPQSISPETAAALVALADATGAAHPGQRYPAEGIRAALSPAAAP